MIVCNDELAHFPWLVAHPPATGICLLCYTAAVEHVHLVRRGTGFATYGIVLEVLA